MHEQHVIDTNDAVVTADPVVEITASLLGKAMLHVTRGKLCLPFFAKGIIDNDRFFAIFILGLDRLYGLPVIGILQAL